MKEEQEKALKEKQKAMKEHEEEEFEEKNEEELNISEKKNTSVHNNNEINISQNPPIENQIVENSQKKDIKEELIDEKPKDLQKENQYFIDFGSFTRRKLIRSLKNCKKLVWIDSMCPNENENFNQTTVEISKFLCSYQEEKNSLIHKEKDNVDGVHNYEEDKIVFLFGKELEQQLNSFDLIDPAEIKQSSQKDENEENKSQLYENDKNEENKSQVSGQGNVPVNKRNNIPLVSDFYARDSDYACKILSGRYPYGNQSLIN